LCRTDAIAGRYGAATAGCFVDYDGEWLVFRGKNHKISRGVDSGQLRLIHKTEEANTRRNTEVASSPLEFLALRAFASVNQERVRQFSASKGAKQILRSLPGLELRTKENHGGLRCGTPTRPDSLTVHFLRMVDPPVVVNGDRGKGDFLLREAQGQDQ